MIHLRMYDVIQNDTSHFGVLFCIISYILRCIIVDEMYDIIQNDTSHFGV